MPLYSSSSTRRTLCWALSAFFLALAVRANDGAYSPWGMVGLTIAMGCAFVGAFLREEVLGGLPDAPHVLNRVLAACSVFFGAFWLMPDGLEPRWGAYGGALVVCALIAGVLTRLTRMKLVRKLLFPSFLVLQTLFGVSTILKAKEYERTSPEVKFQMQNDVQAFEIEAAQALLAGRNPYSLHMPNVIGADLPYYPAGATDKKGRLPFGYPYLPLSLLFILPAHLLGDFRFAHVLALTGTAFFLAYARPSVTSQLAATVFGLFPCALLVLVMSWIEPVLLFFLGATLFCALRAPRWLPLALGCLVASKQYTVFLLVLLPLLVPDNVTRRRVLWQALGVAALLTLPLALWDAESFYRSVIATQFKQPFRDDALSYLVAIRRLGGPTLTPLLAFVSMIGVLWWGATRAQRGAAQWCGIGALAYLGFFAFNKQAFVNYYFWAFALLLAAVAVALPASTPEPVSEA